MASLKAEKPASADLSGQTKKEPTKPSSTAPKAAGSKPAPKKSEQKPAGGSKKKAAGGKAKN